MSRVIRTGSDAVLRSRAGVEAHLLAKTENNTNGFIGTELELFVTTKDGRPLSYAQIEKLFGRIAAETGAEKALENGHVVALHIADVGDVCLEPGGQVELSTKPCKDLAELEDSNKKLRAALEAAAAHFGLRVKGQGHMPSFLEAEDMPRSRFAAYYRYCRHEIGAAAAELVKTMKSVCSLQVNVDPMGRDFHEIYRALMLLDVAAAFNRVSKRRERLDETYARYFGAQTEPVFGALRAKSNAELMPLLADRLLTLKVPFVPDASPEGFKSSLDVFGTPPTVGELLARGELTQEILDNALSLQLTPPNLRRHGVVETRLLDSVDTTADVMRVARRYRTAAYDAAARAELLARFEKADPDLLRAVFNARGMVPHDKLMKMDIGGGLTAGDLAAEAESFRPCGAAS
ncbi:MAG: hypothetical protein KGQ70_06915, partial [Alphaproteobacteria bacterium]|nr:hypothetical protein [Alphaproteobacteria bacterium]